jgi:hypothetical protein
MALFPEEPNWDELHGQDPPKIDAELRDVDGHVISKGEALFFSDNAGSFYPRDSANQDAILSRAKTLFLTGEKKSLTISIKPCPEELPHELHFHLRISN